tara:strand:- start:4095 stop:5171 length:1077 start_codon:yes stop_codon:yes gene_type:complete
MKLVNSYLNKKKKLIYLTLINTFILWQLSYYIFILWDQQIFFDSNSYISMAKGQFDVIQHHGYRIVLPIISSFLSKIISIFRFQSIVNENINTEINIRISFYLINLFLSSFIFYFLFESLKEMKYRTEIIISSIFCFQLSTIYLFYIAIPNADIGVIFFLSLGLFIFYKIKNFTIFFIFNLFIVISGTLFKEYIFLTNLPILLMSLGEIKYPLKRKLIYLFTYLSTNVFFLVLFRKIINYIISITTGTSFLGGSTSKYIIKSIVNIPFNLYKFQDVLQYSPFLILIILVIGFLSEKKFKINNYQYKKFPNIYLFTAFFIFLLLSGAAIWSTRIFFPFFIYLLPKTCEYLQRIQNKISF